MPQETQPVTASVEAQLIASLQVTVDMIRDDTQRLREENKELRVTLAGLSDTLRDVLERTGDMAGDMSRLAKMGDEASVFLDSPVAKYLARMRKLKAPEGG